jgi:alpha-tubulin suppressor-like RCC1 family protein
MPDKKISQFDTFTGATGEDVFFIISSGEADNSNAKNYKVPFDDLKSDLGLDAGGGGAIIGGDTENINFGGTTPGDNRDINFQQGGESVMVINQDGDVNIKNDLSVSGSISGASGSFNTINVSNGLTVSGGISGDVISGASGSFNTINVSNGLTVSGGISGDVISGASGSFNTINVSNGLTVSGGISGDVISGASGSFNTINVSNGLTVSGGISGDVISGKTGIFSDYLSSPTGYFEEIIVSGDAYISGDFYVSGTTYINEVIDTTVSGTISGHTGIFDTISGKKGDFSERLTISGETVLTGNAGGIGGKWLDSVTAGDIYYTGGKVGIGTDDPSAKLHITGGKLLAPTGDFSEELTVSGVSVLTGNQQASIQWLEDVGGGKLTVRESALNGVNFINSKWYDSTVNTGDIYYTGGNVGVNNNDPQADLDVSGDIYSERVKIGNCTIYSDGNENLVFDWGAASSPPTPSFPTSPGLTSSFSAGEEYSILLKNDSTLWGAGLNVQGQLGNGTNTNINSFSYLSISDVSKVSAGRDHTMIIKTDGTLWSFGKNTYGKLGDGTTIDRNSPVQILTDVAEVSVGNNHALIVKTNGSLWAVGNNTFGQLGDGTNVNKNTPTQILSSGVAKIAAGTFHSLIIKDDGSLHTFGYNLHAQLGDGTGTSRNTPTQILISGVAQIAGGDEHSLIVKTDGTLWSFGRSAGGKLGLSTSQANYLSPTQVTSVSGVVQITAAKDISAFVKNDGSLSYMGTSTQGFPATTIPAAIVGSGVTEVASSFLAEHVIFRKSDGKYYGQGSNDNRQIKDTPTLIFTSPEEIPI